MLRTILMIAGGLIMLGLGIALLNTFNGDIGAIFDWAWRFITGVVDSIAKFFENNSFFQRIVQS